MRPGRILGLDIGGVRIGVAISDEMGILASPIGMIRRGEGGDPDVDAAMRTYITQYQPVRLVAGLPVGLSGREGPQAREVRDYADALAARLDMNLEYWDERLTTSIAERTLVNHGVRKRERRDKIDAMAASVILQSYLDHLRWRAQQD